MTTRDYSIGSEKNKQYYEENREALLEKSKQYYQENREELLEKRKQKVECECGMLVNYSGIARHTKTKIHAKRMAANPREDLVII
jgi:hypothetical protein